MKNRFFSRILNCIKNEYTANSTENFQVTEVICDLERILEKDCQIFRIVTLLEQTLRLMLVLLSSTFFEEFLSHLTSRECFRFRLPKLTFGFLDK